MKRARTDAEREAAKHLTEDEIWHVTQLSDRITAAIERTSRVGLALKAMISLDTLNEVLEIFVDVASSYIKTEKQRQAFIDEILRKSAAAVEEQDTKFKQLMEGDAGGLRM